MKRSLQEVDPDIFKSVQLEKTRLNTTLELIASENFVSRAVLEAAGSELTGGGYARQSCALGTATGGTVSNTADEVFTATGNMGTADYAAVYSASTGGTLYVGSALSTGRAMVTGATLAFVTGAIDLTIT